MPDQTVVYILREYGLAGLVLVTCSAMVAAAVAQIQQLRKWQPQTTTLITQTSRILNTLESLIAHVDRQHTVCLRHQDLAREQLDGMRALGAELRSVVTAIHQSDQERNREVMQLMLLLSGRPRATD